VRGFSRQQQSERVLKAAAEALKEGRVLKAAAE